jgi:hypothetical protein
VPAAGRLREYAAPGLAEQPARAGEDLMHGGADVTEVIRTASRRHHRVPPASLAVSRYVHDISTA